MHHSGHTFSLSLAGRLPWPLRLVDDFVCLPLLLVGFDPLLVFLCMGVSFAAQYLVHTKAIGKLGPLDWVFNTPSNHRVHHHAEGTGQQRNFGAALMVWDRLFGTYQAEAGPQAFGIDGVPNSQNPFEIQVQGFRRYFASQSQGETPPATSPPSPSTGESQPAHCRHRRAERPCAQPALSAWAKNRPATTGRSRGPR